MEDSKVIGNFKLLIMNPDRVIFEGEVQHLFCQGDTGEFELQPHHYPLLSVLTGGKLVIDWVKSVTIKKGIVKFFKNECTVIVEQKKSNDEKEKGQKE